jgi:hypothetical protein
MAQHKWHKEIKAWADGAKIEYDRGDSIWIETVDPMWHNHVEYRVKPSFKEPQYLYVYLDLSWNDQSYKLTRRQGDYGTYMGKIKLEVEDHG